MANEIKEIGEKIDTHFHNLNTKFDAHEEKEWKLIDLIIKRIDKTDEKLKKLENDVLDHKWLFGIVFVLFILLACNVLL